MYRRCLYEQYVVLCTYLYPKMGGVNKHDKILIIQFCLHMAGFVCLIMKYLKNHLYALVYVYVF